MTKLNTFSLYLGKSDATDLEELLTEKARDLVRQGSAEVSTSSEFADGAVLYTFPGHLTVPKWVRLLAAYFLLPENIFSKSPSAVLLFRKSGSIFALTFSYAHVYVDDARTEPDFRLKVTINAVSDEKLRSVERSNIGIAIRDFAQAAGQRDLRSFGFDDALDLIRKVSGRAADDEFANMVTGARSLRFSKQIELAEVPAVAAEALRLFESPAYRDTGFRIIDFLSPVLDPVMESHLDDTLLAAVRGRSDEFEIAIPAIVPESVGSFRFEHAGFSDFHPDLSLDLYRDELGDRLATLALAYGEAEDRPFQYWSVHRSLVGSIVLAGERYALNEANWYRINQAFKDAADRKFLDLCGEPDRKLRPLRKIYQSQQKGRKPKVVYQSEESYNSEIASETGYLLLDRRLIQIEEMPGPGVGRATCSISKGAVSSM